MQWFCVWACLRHFYQIKISESFPKWHKAIRHLRMESIGVRGGRITHLQQWSFWLPRKHKAKSVTCGVSCAGVSDGALLPVLWRRLMLFMEGSPYTSWHTFNMDYFTQFNQLDSVQDVTSIYGSYSILFISFTSFQFTHFNSAFKSLQAKTNFSQKNLEYKI